jgi:hypothetical protein
MNSHLHHNHLIIIDRIRNHLIEVTYQNPKLIKFITIWNRRFLRSRRLGRLDC